MKELKVLAKMENLDAVQDFVRQEMSHTSLKTQNQTAIAVDEIFSNIARYAYPPLSDNLEVTIRIDTKDNIILEFEDLGIPFNPLKNEEPDTGLSVDEREIGGLGIHLVKKLMDDVSYRRDGNKNILTLFKVKQ